MPCSSQMCWFKTFCDCPVLFFSALLFPQRIQSSHWFVAACALTRSVTVVATLVHTHANNVFKICLFHCLLVALFVRSAFNPLLDSSTRHWLALMRLPHLQVDCRMKSHSCEKRIKSWMRNSPNFKWIWMIVRGSFVQSIDYSLRYVNFFCMRQINRKITAIWTGRGQMQTNKMISRQIKWIDNPSGKQHTRSSDPLIHIPKWTALAGI